MNISILLGNENEQLNVNISINTVGNPRAWISIEIFDALPMFSDYRWHLLLEIYEIRHLLSCEPSVNPVTL